MIRRRIPVMLWNCSAVRIRSFRPIFDVANKKIANPAARSGDFTTPPHGRKG